MRLSTFASLLVAAAVMMPNASVVADIIIPIDNYSSETNDRFQDSDVPDAFFLSYDLSGVGQSDSGRWATLIGPNTIVSANHLRPSGAISFYPDNLSSSTPIQIAISSDSQRIANTDLWLARLAEHVPGSIHVFAHAKAQIRAPTAQNGSNSEFSFKGDHVFMTKRSPAGFPATQDQAYGTNIISSFVENDTSAGLGTVDAFELAYNVGGTMYEAFLQPKDSGAPLFTAGENGELLLLGVNSYITTTAGDEPEPIASYVSYLGNESATIDALVAQWAAVPEPSSFVSLAIAVLAVGFVLRRSRGACLS